MIPSNKMEEKYGKEVASYRESECLNPLSVFEQYFFSNGSRDENYRTSALNKCLTDRLDFEMTENNKGNILKSFVKVFCPECDIPMEFTGDSHLRCSCGNKIYLGVEDFNFVFSKKEVFKVEALDEVANENRVIVPIKAWINSKDTEGKIVAEVIKINRKFGDKWFVKVNYINNRALTDEKIQNLIDEVVVRLQHEGLESED